MGCHSTKCKEEEELERNFTISVMTTNEENAKNIAEALKITRKQAEASFEKSKAITSMALTQNRLQEEYLRERERVDKLQGENDEFRNKIIDDLEEEISRQKEDIAKLFGEKARIENRAAEAEQELVDLRAIYDESEEDIKELKKVMNEMREKNKESNDQLVEELRKADVAMLNQAISLIAMR